MLRPRRPRLVKDERSALTRSLLRLAKAVVVRLADVAAAEVEGGFALSCGGTLQAKLSIAWMALPN